MEKYAMHFYLVTYLFNNALLFFQYDYFVLETFSKNIYTFCPQLIDNDALS